jgi:hypothetical protein
MSVSPARNNMRSHDHLNHLDQRRFAVDNALGSLSIEKMDLEPTERQVFERYARGEISLDEMDRLAERMAAANL